MKSKIFTRVFVVLTSLLFVVVSAPAVELFRYRRTKRSKDGRRRARNLEQSQSHIGCFSETIEGPIQRMFVVVLLPSGMVVHREIFEYIEVY
jgi:hypothetical protein